MRLACLCTPSVGPIRGISPVHARAAASESVRCAAQHLRHLWQTQLYSATVSASAKLRYALRLTYWIGIITMLVSMRRDRCVHSGLAPDPTPAGRQLIANDGGPGENPMYASLSDHMLYNIVMMPLHDVDPGACRSITAALNVAEFKWVCQLGTLTPGQYNRVMPDYRDSRYRTVDNAASTAEPDAVMRSWRAAALAVQRQMLQLWRCSFAVPPTCSPMGAS